MKLQDGRTLILLPIHTNINIKKTVLRYLKCMREPGFVIVIDYASSLRVFCPMSVLNIFIKDGVSRRRRRIY